MGSNRSPSPARSGTPDSNRSGSYHSRSGSASALGSPVSNRSQNSRSRSRSKSHSRSRSGSAASDKSNRSNQSTQSRQSRRSISRSRSGSHKSGSGSRSGSRSRSGSNASRASNQSNGISNKSRSRSGSRSGSAQSNRSNVSAQSRRSARSSSKTPSQRSKSRSQSRSRSPVARSRSRSNSHQESPPNDKRRSPKGSGSENDEDKGTDAADLFGDADDISSDEDKDKQKETSKEYPSDDDDRPERRRDDERSDCSDDEDNREKEEEKEEEPEPIPETRIDVKIPKISCDLGKEIHFVKLPNFLSVETRPFDADTYEDEIDEEETLDEEGRARLKLKVENTIRWREEINKDGDFVKQSNARLVRWSDGSLSLHLGSEIFDVYKQPLQGDHNHLFIRQGTGLQGQAVFRTKLSFRPHSTESFTHRKMTLSLADRSQKTSGIKIISQVGIDPDQDRKSLLKKEEEKLRQTFRQSKPRKRGDGSRLHVSQAYREEDGSEDEGAISLNAIKNKYKGGNIQSKGGAIYSSDEEGSDFEARRSKKLDKPKALKDSESSEDSD